MKFIHYAIILILAVSCFAVKNEPSTIKILGNDKYDKIYDLNPVEVIEHQVTYFDTKIKNDSVYGLEHFIVVKSNVDYEIRSPRFWMMQNYSDSSYDFYEFVGHNLQPNQVDTIIVQYNVENLAEWYAVILKRYCDEYGPVVEYKKHEIIRGIMKNPSTKANQY